MDIKTTLPGIEHPLTLDLRKAKQG
jgi:hypothetical protein